MSCKQETTVYLVKYRWIKLAFDDVNKAFQAYQTLSAAQFVEEGFFGPKDKKALYLEPDFQVTMETIQSDKMYDSKEQAQAALCPPDKPDNLDDDEAVAA